MERTLQASVWPSMQYASSNYDSEREEWRIALAFSNQGVGPAQMRELKLTYQGQDIGSGVGPFLALCCAPDGMSRNEAAVYLGGMFEADRFDAFYAQIAPRVFAPGERLEMVSFPRPGPDDPEADALWLAASEARNDLEIEICYCSVFDQCWRAYFPNERREPVEQCQAPEAG